MKMQQTFINYTYKLVKKQFLTKNYSLICIQKTKFKVYMFIKKIEQTTTKNYILNQEI